MSSVSVYAIRTAPLDAIPDISDPQVIIYAKWPRSPQLLEAQVTEPVDQGADRVARHSLDPRDVAHGLLVHLRDPARHVAARRRARSRCGATQRDSPAAAARRHRDASARTPAASVGSTSTRSSTSEQLRDLRELRLLNESQIKPALQTLPGIAEVASVGGLEKQYQLKVFPPLLADAGISLRQLIDTLRGAFEEAGGRTIEVTNRDYQIRGVVNHDNIDDLEALVVGHARDGRPVQLKDVGYIQVGLRPAARHRRPERRGRSRGRHRRSWSRRRTCLQITHALEEQLAEIGASLPQGVEIVPTYDRSQLDLGHAQALLRDAGL